jgi:hypothetical protein
MIPDEYRSVWKGEILGQAANSHVTFTLQATDKESLQGIDPKSLCGTPPVAGCKTPFSYLVGYQYSGPLVLNEVCPLNLTVAWDATDRKFEDYIEIVTTADVEIAGYYLATNPFRPDDWLFPANSAAMKAGDHLLVWCDDDGSDTNGTKAEYHTSFNLAHEGDGIFIFKPETTGFGLVDGLKFGLSESDRSWSRCPDGSRSSEFIAAAASPKAANTCETPLPTFIRGDVDNSGGLELTDAINILDFLFKGGAAPGCLDAADANDVDGIDLSDPIYILFYLYASGPQPPAPFPEKGPDPTPDDLGCNASI